MRLANWKLFWVKMPENKGNDMLQNKYFLTDDIYDIIIVGGGITGIISAAVLSGAGKKVMLAERTGEYGGMFRMIEHKGEEYYFGAHHIAGICGDSATGAMLGNLGIQIERDLKKVTHIRILSGHKTFDVPLDLDGLEEYIKSNYPHEPKTEDFFDLMRQYQRYFREDDDKGLLKMFVENSRITYLQLLRLYFQNAEIIKILTALGPGYGGIGVQGVAFNNLSLLISYSLGSGCFKKSNTEVIHDLISRAKEKGCVFLEQTECVDLVLREQAVEGAVFQSGGERKEYRCKNVLFASYPFGILDKYLTGSRLQRKLGNFQPGASVVRVCGLLDGIGDMVLGDMVYMGDYSVEELDSHILLEESSARLPVCMVYTYREGKKVKVMFTFLVRADNKTRIREEHLLERIRNEFPEIAGRWEECFILYDDEYKAATATEWGSVFGWERTPYNYMNTNAYTPCVPGIKGVYAAGNWTTDYGVYGALRTVRKVCAAIMGEGKEKRNDSVKKCGKNVC